MDKICTTIEQSKKLIELGIDVKTADMYYTSEHSTPSIMTGAKSDYSSYIPAWSLSALLELMPKTINEDFYYELDIYYKHELWRIVYYAPNLNEHLMPSYNKNLIDAAFGMVCYLLENGYIAQKS